MGATAGAVGYTVTVTTSSTVVVVVRIELLLLRVLGAVVEVLLVAVTGLNSRVVVPLRLLLKTEYSV